MKKTRLLLILGLAIAARAQQPASAQAELNAPAGTEPTTVSFPFERIQTPTPVDLACAGFVSKQLVPNSNFVAGDLYTPSDTKNSNGEVVYLAGKGYEVGQKYTVVRELRDPNRYEIFAGQHTLMKTMGQPYSELARVRVIDTRSKMAIAEIEMSCDPVNPGRLRHSICREASHLLPSAVALRSLYAIEWKVDWPDCDGKRFRFRDRTRRQSLSERGRQPGSEAGRLFPRCALLRSRLARSNGFSLVQSFYQ